MYAASLDGMQLQFEVLSVWRRNMVLRDQQTGSIWQQSTGECVAGPLRGRSLEVLAGVYERFGAWRKEHPETLVAMESKVWTGLLPKALIEKMLERATRSAYTPGLTTNDERIARNTHVAGLVHRGESAAWTLSLLQEKRSLTSTLGGESITITYDEASDRVRAVTSSGTALRVFRTYWAGWFEFHPGTKLEA